MGSTRFALASAYALEVCAVAVSIALLYHPRSLRSVAARAARLTARQYGHSACRGGPSASPEPPLLVQGCLLRDRAHYYTASFSSLAGRNAIFLLALILMASPVAGFRPIRAARFRTRVRPFFDLLDQMDGPLAIIGLDWPEDERADAYRRLSGPCA
jgi:hypothetical protein